MAQSTPPPLNGTFWKQLAVGCAVLLVGVLTWTVMQTTVHGTQLSSLISEGIRLNVAITRIDAEVLRIGQIQATRTTSVDTIRQLAIDLAILEKKVNIVEYQALERSAQTAARLDTISKRILSLEERLDRLAPASGRGTEVAPDAEWPMR